MPTTRTSKLPPLILHPFAEPFGPTRLMEGSRAGLILQGLLPSGSRSVDELERRLLEGRYAELMMLFYLGKDLLRWAGQCLEVAERNPDLSGAGFRGQSFFTLLIEATPAKVDEKLRQWGVHEYKRIFSRAIGLHAIFEALPELDALAPDFVRHYHRFADALYACGRQLFPFASADSTLFDFDLYASGEYARMLEQQWEEQ